MSDSETTNLPAESAIVKALRDVVISIHKGGNTDDLTIKRVRARAETELGLPDGFLRRQEWKQKSQSLIHEAVEKYCDDAEPEPEPSPPKKAAKAKPAPRKIAKPSKASAGGVKRKAAAPAKKPQKRRRTVSSEDELPDAAEDKLSDAESEPPKKPARRQKKVVAEDSDEEDAPKAQKGLSDEDVDDVAVKKTPPPQSKDDAEDSDLSSLIDESPVKKKKRGPADKPKKEAKAKAPPKASANDPDQAEVKRLQSWLVKCGIRKVWGKELASCNTSKEKIKHLKAMLSEAGMEGKYSNEKAARIKEQREFAKDLEAIQAGAEAWGKQEVTDTGRPRRAASRPVPKAVAPVFSEDGEEANEAQDDAEDSTDDDQDDSDVKGDSDKSEDDVHDGDGDDSE
ncbi:hypothetical protein P280DRAFT_470072 [Massarina eburnea CBS 473.64]|uniref:Transcriptional regulator n=1 Tax=Massarina eburnea CBS 473.64 TaxID=1395130 RepID=A0A6A6S2D9_9PLEO|nr:hypothetical protein P280DRAFT_470072 [Massarina eburnea CBS 473.64]